jgi:hypothetical protein
VYRAEKKKRCKGFLPDNTTSGVQKGEHIIDPKTGIPESSIVTPLIADEFCAENKTPISLEVIFFTL